MSKLLTISIAAYNVEKYLENTLESLINDKIIDELEVLIIDDGATDHTAQIAKKYCDKYPQSIKFVHKTNGGYGTVVNMAVEIATGQYFKLLDGDDWFDFKGLTLLVQKLKSTNADVIFSPMYEVYPDKKELVQDLWGKYKNTQMTLSQVPKGIHAGMWEITIKTEILKEHWMELPGKTLYTDHLFIMIPIPYIKKVEFVDFPVYCYRLGYDEQSVSTVSRKKHIDEIMKVSNMATKYFHEKCLGTENEAYAKERARFCHMEAIRSLMLFPCNLDTMRRIRQFDQELKQTDISVYNECMKYGERRAIKLLRATNYWAFYVIKIKRTLKQCFAKR